MTESLPGQKESCERTGSTSCCTVKAWASRPRFRRKRIAPKAFIFSTTQFATVLCGNVISGQFCTVIKLFLDTFYQ